MGLLINMHERGFNWSQFGNHQPMYGLTKICSFQLYGSLDQAQSAIEVLREWFFIEGIHQTEAVELAGNFLGIIATGEYVDGNKFSFESAPIGTNEGVISVREGALEIVNNAINSRDPTIRIKGIDAAEKIGSRVRGAPPKPDSPIWQVVESEIHLSLNVIEGMIPVEDNLAVMSSIERLLWTWWSQLHQRLSDRCLELIQAIPETPDYMLLKSIFSSNCPVYGSKAVNSILKEKQIDDRRRFFIKELVNLRATPEEFLPLIESVEASLTPQRTWLDVFYDLSNQYPTGTDTVWRSYSVLNALVITNESAAWNLADELPTTQPLDAIGTQILAILRQQRPEDWWANFSRSKARDLACADAKIVLRWLRSLYGHELTKNELEFVDRCLLHTETSIRDLAITISAQSDPRAITSAIKRIRKNPPDHLLWEGLFRAVETDPEQAVAYIEEILSLVCELGLKPKFPTQRDFNHVDFLKLLAVEKSSEFAEVLTDVWNRTRRGGWSERRDTVFDDFRIHDVFRLTDQRLDKPKWTSIIVQWIHNGLSTSKLGIELLPSLASISDREIGGLLLHLSTSQDESDFVNLLRILWELRDDEGFPAAVVNLLETPTISTPRKEEIAKAFTQDIRYASSTRTVGEKSPVDLRNLDILETLFRDTGLSSSTKHIIRRAIESLEAHVDNELKEDEEIIRGRK